MLCAAGDSHPSPRHSQLQEPATEADGAASALAFVAAGFGVAVVGEPLEKIPAKDVIFRDLAPKEGAWVPVGAAWKPDGVSAPVVPQFVEVLAQTCAGGNGGGLLGSK